MDYDCIGDLSEEFTCQVCMKLLNEPQLTDCCGQHFCYACLDRWFQRTGKKTCPHCRSETFTHILNKQLKRKIDELKVYCSNRSKGCREEMKLEELERHLSIENSTGCGFVNIDCKNKCGQSILRKDLTDHYDNNCPKRTISCKYCNEAGPYSYISNEQDGGHIQKCHEYPVDCPRMCDSTVGDLKRKDLKAHKEVCPLEPVECPFREAGCVQKLVRKDLEGHIESNTQQHLFNLLGAHKRLSVEHEELKKSNHKLRSAIAYATSEVDNIHKTVSVKDKRGLATSLQHIARNLSEAALHLSKVGDNVTIELSSTSEWIGPTFGIGQSLQLYLKLTPRTNTLSLVLVNGILNGQWNIEVEVKCDKRSRKSQIKEKCRQKTHEFPLCNKGMEMEGTMTLPTDFVEGYYKTCIIKLTVRRHRHGVLTEGFFPGAMRCFRSRLDSY